MVKVVTGSYKGKEGRVIEVVRDTNRALVEGVNKAQDVIASGAVAEKLEQLIAKTNS